MPIKINTMNRTNTMNIEGVSREAVKWIKVCVLKELRTEQDALRKESPK
ncbi:hypothetical protein QR98_0076700 [Sarcoptes scabiei]|uniref:Uncharacterized protein n=1 Tax=Sarcoptes scabiei TaxID=52283 RepID=A0A132ADY3_SARSC|nr:hypothetical protein QR98_0076700 [Sarcoptes scabiei]